MNAKEVRKRTAYKDACTFSYFYICSTCLYNSSGDARQNIKHVPCTFSGHVTWTSIVFVLEGTRDVIDRLNGHGHSDREDERTIFGDN